MNRLTLAMLISILCCYMASAQKVTVGNQSQKVKNETAKGFQVALEGKPEDVAPAWNKFLKDSGKGKSSGELLVITEPTVGGTLYEKGILYARSAGTGEKSTAWVGLLESEWSADELELVNKELEQLVYRFGVKFYKDKIQKQIDESVNAAQAVERQAQRASSEAKTLGNKLVSNEHQKVQLEKSLEENKLENLVLKQKIVNNKNAQDSLAQVAIQIQKVVDMHKERQMKVN
jgi:hypothetical protein